MAVNRYLRATEPKGQIIESDPGEEEGVYLAITRQRRATEPKGQSMKSVSLAWHTEQQVTASFY